MPHTPQPILWLPAWAGSLILPFASTFSYQNSKHGHDSISVQPLHKFIPLPEGKPLKVTYVEAARQALDLDAELADASLLK